MQNKIAKKIRRQLLKECLDDNYVKNLTVEYLSKAALFNPEISTELTTSKISYLVEWITKYILRCFSILTVNYEANWANQIELLKKINAESWQFIIDNTQGFSIIQFRLHRVYLLKIGSLEMIKSIFNLESALINNPELYSNLCTNITNDLIKKICDLVNQKLSDIKNTPPITNEPIRRTFLSNQKAYGIRKKLKEKLCEQGHLECLAHEYISINNNQLLNKDIVLHCIRWITCDILDYFDVDINNYHAHWMNQIFLLKKLKQNMQNLDEESNTQLRHKLAELGFYFLSKFYNSKTNPLPRIIEIIDRYDLPNDNPEKYTTLYSKIVDELIDHICNLIYSKLSADVKTEEGRALFGLMSPAPESTTSQDTSEPKGRTVRFAVGES